VIRVSTQSIRPVRAPVLRRTDLWLLLKVRFWTKTSHTSGLLKPHDRNIMKMARDENKDTGSSGLLLHDKLPRKVQNKGMHELKRTDCAI
jgi:hypothetical protein